MKLNFILSILLISCNWAIGLQGLVIPQNGKILSTAGTGIAEANARQIFNPWELKPAVNLDAQAGEKSCRDFRMLHCG